MYVSWCALVSSLEKKTIIRLKGRGIAGHRLVLFWFGWFYLPGFFEGQDYCKDLILGPPS